MIKFEKVSAPQYFNDMMDGSTDQAKSIAAKEYYEAIKLPVRGTKESAGYDFFAPFAFKLAPGEGIKIATGIKAQITKGIFLGLFPRSGLGFKYRLQLDNTVGIVDSDYYNNIKNEGHIFIKITNDGDKEMSVKQGEGFAQGIFMPFFLTDDDAADTIREGGLGSTTK